MSYDAVTRGNKINEKEKENGEKGKNDKGKGKRAKCTVVGLSDNTPTPSPTTTPLATLHKPLPGRVIGAMGPCRGCIRSLRVQLCCSFFYASCHVRIKNCATSSTTRNHRSAFCDFSRHPNPVLVPNMP